MTATHLLGLRELEPATIQQLLDEADTWATDANGGSEILRGRRVGTVFYEPSTRTEISFELAARRLGAEVVRCDVEHSSVKKGESLVDTGRTLEALGLDALVLRHPCAGASHLLARAVRCAVINAGDGMHEHPTQGLVDLLTVRQTKGHAAGLQVAIVGDILHSRVARSALWGFTKLGARVRLVGPRTLIPTDVEALGAETASSLDEGLRGADVVMALRMQLERQRGGDVPSLAEYARMYEITPAVLSRLSPAVIVLHPGPINPGVDIDPVVAVGAQSVIARQVTNGIPVRMAVLRWALEGAWRDARVEDRRVANLVSVAATAN